MTKKTGGGSATNSGIDYQQRIAACFQIFLYTQFKIDQVLNEDFPFTVKSVHFETADAIDDLLLACDKDHKIYLQIKRSTSFSDTQESEFIKTLDQFIEQHAKGGTKNYYVLVTSSEGSRRITGELRKVLTGIRLNDTSFNFNPLNKSEKEVYERFQTAFFNRSEVLTGNKPDLQKFIDFAKKVYVEVMDVEAGMSLEKSAKLLLADKMHNPELVWALLIKNSLVYAANRASINKGALEKILDNYKLRNNQPLSEDQFESIIRDSVSLTGEYSCNKEVLIFESEDGEKHEIMEVKRFTDTCTKGLSFSDNKVKFGNDPAGLQLVFRGSSGIGLERFIEQNPNALADKPLVIFQMPAVDNGPEECIRLYQQYLEQLANENQNIGNCLHCGKPVGKTENLLIEIDDDDTPSSIGACHLACRRPMDRVLGTARIENDFSSPYLEDFDFKKWVALSMKGNIVLDGLPPAMHGKANIAWSGFQHQGNGDFCLRFQMKDGTKRFAFHRGNIERLSEQEAIDHANRAKQEIKKHQEEHDPLGFTTKVRQYGAYSRLLPGIDDDDEFVEITDAMAVRYSLQEAKIHDSGRMYYAPLCLVVDKTTDKMFTIGNMVPIISDPKKIEPLAKSWRRAGISVNNISLRILTSDQEVDILFAKLFNEKMIVFLNPLLDQKAAIVSGFIIRSAEDIVEEMRREREEKTQGLWEIDDPDWRKGDLVQIIVPGEDDQPKKLFGQLLYDEASTSEGKRMVIFQPIENGVPVEEVELVIPSTLVSDWDAQKEN